MSHGAAHGPGGYMAAGLRGQPFRQLPVGNGSAIGDQEQLLPYQPAEERAPQKQRGREIRNAAAEITIQPAFGFLKNQQGFLLRTLRQKAIEQLDAKRCPSNHKPVSAFPSEARVMSPRGDG